MAQTIMLIPTAAKVNPHAAAQNLNLFLKNKNVKAILAPEFDLNNIEIFLAASNLNDLLTSLTENIENISQNNDVIITSGLSLNKPYATELNFNIATALDASIIFVTPSEGSVIRDLKIVSSPYQYRYQKTILGFMVDQNGSISPELQQQLTAPLDFIGPNNDFNFTKIQSYLENPPPKKITPSIFKHQLISKAKKANKKIILPEGNEPRTIKAANICAEQNIARCVLLGDKNQINETCNNLNLKLHSRIEIIEPQQVVEKYVAPLFEMRRAKGITIEKVKKQLTDNVSIGTLMLHLGEADGLVSGAIHTTANTIRPAFQIIKTTPEAKLVSSIFFMCLPDQVLVFGDCAINPNPSAEELADIAIQSAKSAQILGIKPKVAMLSYSTGASGFGPSVDKIKKATEIVKTIQPKLEVEGPIQYDAAISEETAKIKLPNNNVAGKATVFIMPNLDVGNIVYKAVQRSTGIICIGPMLQGLNKPVNDLSRGCSIEDIVFTIAITAIQG